MNGLLILSPENYEKNKPTKILDNELNKLKSFSAGFNFYFETLEYDSLHDAMGQVFELEACFITLGELTEYGKVLEETRKTGQRRKKGKDPTIQDKIGSEIVLDLDDHYIENFDVLNPEPGIKSWLLDREINCDVTWQITSGQKLNSKEARLRLYFESTAALSLAERKAWAQSPGIEADGSIFTCSQPVYTAPPVIEGGLDPIERRWGFIEGESRKITLPKFTPAEIVKYSNHFRGAEYDFDNNALPEDVMSGRVYRRYFMPLAFHYANKLKGDREAIFAIIAAKSSLVTSRVFEAENVYEYIDAAIDKINIEEEETTQPIHDILTIADILRDDVPTDIPSFPEELLREWPEPWPSIWENFSRVPRQLEEALLVPTILSINAFFLRANYVTSYGRRPNLFFLNLTPSTGNKDVNSKNVIRDLDLIFKKKGTKTNLFSGILNTESSITADTTFLQSFNEAEELFWINTEATRIFQQIKTAGSVSAVAALSDKLIELVDGHEITGKIKAAGKVKTIQNPNAQVLFYAQPETIERYIDESMVDSGLFGRSLLSIVPNLKFDIDEYEMFKVVGGVDTEIDQDFFDFYTGQQFNLSALSAGKVILAPTKASRELLNAWAREYVAPKMAEDDSLQKVLSRIGNSAEQLYCIILGICQLHDLHTGADIRQEIDIMMMIPLLEYWVDTKIYAIKHFVNTALDPLAESILEIIRNAIAGKYKLPGTYDNKCRKQYHMVSRAQVMRILKSNTKLIRQLSADGDKRNAIVRAEQILKVFISTGVLKEDMLKIGSSTKTCIGILK